MKILLVSALYPPDVVPPAPYIKELTKRLALENGVSVLTYGRFPEAVEGATFTVVSKLASEPVRLWQFTRQLISLAAKHDTVLVHNAPSTELPMLLASLFTHTHWQLINSDQKINYVGWRKWLHQLAKQRVSVLQITLPTERPEILPFREPSEADWQAHEASWQAHLQAIKDSFYGHTH